MRGRRIQPDGRRRSPQISGLSHRQCPRGTNMVFTRKAVRAGQCHRRIGIDIATATEHIRQYRIGPVEVQVAQHINAAAAQ
ncbi:Uncharacterised protein [Yersinia frederiksenii]|nr:Uncharacterised protein [Yersinia frederiksenii]